jgi:hypothetical protein
MAYRVKINGVVAVIENGVWTSSTPHYASILNNVLAMEKLAAIDPDSPFFWLNSPATPDPDWLIATEIAKTFDGTVMDQPIAPPPLVINGKVVDESEIVY